MAPPSFADGPDRVQSQGVVGSLSIFGNDVANLVELQAKLATLDFQECKSRIILPLLGLVGGGIVVLGSVPLLLGGLAVVLSRAAGLDLGVSLLIIGGLSIALSAVLAYFCLNMVMGSTHSFRRSREEFIRNLSWLRTVVIHSGRSIR